jgi:surfeit locus 1 family protein
MAMNFRLISALGLGLAGVALLCGLGTWQVQRMYEKRAQLDEMTAGISTPAVPVPAQLDPEKDRYRPVTAEGHFTGQTLYVLSGQPMIGAGVQVISVLEMADGRRLLVDRGFLPDDEKTKPLTVREVKILGNLMWPRDSNQYTPPPDPKTGLWFARDAKAMSALLHTEPTFIVARAPTGDGIEAMPVDTSSIPNDHWGYAITWFLLALVWAVMTAALVWRIRRQKA